MLHQTNTIIHQVCALTIVEHLLYSQPENLYPAVAVVATTCWGLYFVHSMECNKKIGRAQASVCLPPLPFPPICFIV